MNVLRFQNKEWILFWMTKTNLTIFKFYKKVLFRSSTKKTMHFGNVRPTKKYRNNLLFLEDIKLQEQGQRMNNKEFRGKCWLLALMKKRRVLKIYFAHVKKTKKGRSWNLEKIRTERIAWKPRFKRTKFWISLPEKWLCIIIKNGKRRNDIYGRRMLSLHFKKPMGFFRRCLFNPMM